MGKSISKLNKEWHLAHPMLKNATIEERIGWHLDIQSIASAVLFRRN